MLEPMNKSHIGASLQALAPIGIYVYEMRSNECARTRLRRPRRY